jgi:hypothetical protein
MAVGNAGSPAAKTAADKGYAAPRAQLAACARTTGAILEGLESADASLRAKAVAEWTLWLRREADVGEARACDERLRAARG